MYMSDIGSAQPNGSPNPQQQAETIQPNPTAHATLITSTKKLTLKQQVRLTKKTFKSSGYLATLEIKRVSDAQIQLHLLVYHLNTKKHGKIAGEGTLILPNSDPTFQDAEYVAAVNFGEAETLGEKFNSMTSYQSDHLSKSHANPV